MVVGDNNNKTLSIDPCLKDDSLRLLFNFLRISPSYALAHDLGIKRLTRSMPERTKAVLRTYRRFGDVFTKPFEAWAAPHRKLSGKTTSFVQELVTRPDQSILPKPGYSLIEIKQGLSRSQALALIEQVIRRSSHFCSVKAVDTGIRAKTMWRALAVVYARARHPNVELWRIGALTGAIERVLGKIDPNEPKRSLANATMRRDLTLAVIRFLHVALLLSESAALGCFPDIKAPLIEPNQQLVFAFENHELDRRLSVCGLEYDYIVEKNLTSCRRGRLGTDTFKLTPPQIA